MNNKLKDEHMDALFKAVLTLENTDECYKFFEDLCTVLELNPPSGADAPGRSRWWSPPRRLCRRGPSGFPSGRGEAGTSAPEPVPRR